MPTVHLVIKGKVQGVFYRATAKEKADGLRLTGWVQNTPDGNVEIVVSGLQQDLEKFIEWCRKGPARAKVTGMKTEETEPQEFNKFVVKRG